MGHRVFFSFDYEDDLWRATQIRETNVVARTDVAGFFDQAEYEAAEKDGPEGIRRIILRDLEGTSVTVVLIGTLTSQRPWVKYEIEQSLARKNGLLGIYIHHLPDERYTLLRGAKPSVPGNVEFPAYEWDQLPHFVREIEAAGMRSDALRNHRDY